MPVWRTAVVLLAAAVTAAAPGTGPKTVRVSVWADGAEALDCRAPKARIDGLPARVVRALGPDDDLMMLGVLDLAGDLTLVDAAREALAASIRRLPAKAHLGLLKAQEGLGVLVDPTADHAAVAQVIESHSPGGRAGLLDTIEEASRVGDLVLAKASVRLAIFYLTDSNIYNYREDFANPVINSSDGGDLSRRFPEGLVRERISKLASALSTRQAPLFIVHLDYRSDRLNEAYQAGLLELAAATGGTAVFCRSTAEIPEAIGTLLQRVASHWGLDVELPAGRQRQVTIEIDCGGRELNHRGRFLAREP